MAPTNSATRRHLPSLVESGHAEVIALRRRNQEMLINIVGSGAGFTVHTLDQKVHRLWTECHLKSPRKLTGKLSAHEEDQMATPQQPVNNFIDAILGRAQSRLNRR